MLGRWFNIAPALQMTNPYIYCGNSPMMYVDPNGELAWFAAIIPILKGLAIGAGLSAAMYTTQVALSDGGFENWDWGQFGINVGIGAAGGAVGGAAAAGVSKLFTVQSGAIFGSAVGAAGAGTGGFVAGALGSWTTGNSFADGIVKGFETGGLGVITGGLIGGAISGFQAIRAGNNFWTGVPKSAPAPVVQPQQSVKQPSEPNNPVPDRVARVVPGDSQQPNLGLPNQENVFVTGADDINGLNGQQIIDKLGLKDIAPPVKLIEMPV